MRKIIAILLAISVLISISACKARYMETTVDDVEEVLGLIEGIRGLFEENSEYEVPMQQEKSQTVNNGKVLVAYFSDSENALGDYVNPYCEIKRSAETAAQTLGGDLHPVVVEDKYHSDSDRWLDRVSKETSADITLTNRVEDMNNYEYVVLVYGLWYNYVPMPMIKFLESYDFRGKTIICVAQESPESQFEVETQHLSLGAKLHHIELEYVVGSEQVEQQEQALAEFLRSIVDA